MLTASFILPRTLESAVGHAREALTRVPAVVQNPDIAVALDMLKSGAMGAATAVAPLAFAVMLVGIAGAGAQGGIRVATKLFIPKFNRLNPLPGLKKMFGPQSLWEGTKALLKTAVLGTVLYLTVKDLLPVLLTAGQLPLGALLSIVKDTVLTLVRYAAVAGIVLAAVDYAVVKRRTMKQLRMSHQDIKQEHKQQEGDPHVKGQIRSRQMAMARNRQMADVPKADVVLVNPTHVAVALRYDPMRGAPRVVAKGQGAIAQKLRELAGAHRIPMVQAVAL